MGALLELGDRALIKAGEAVGEYAPRLIKRVAPGLAKSVSEVAAPIAEGLTNFADRVATYYPEAAPIANAIRPLRDAAQARAGTVMADTVPLLKSLTPHESTGLADVLLGRVPPEHAASVLTPRTVDLLRRGHALSQESGVPFASSLRSNVAALSPKALKDGGALFQTALKDQSEPLLLNTVKTQLRPMVDQLTDPTAKQMAQGLLTAVEKGGGGTGSMESLRSLQAATLLGRAVIGNATQGVGVSGAVAGVKPSLAALKDVATAAGRAKMSDMALRFGTALDTGATEYLAKDLGTGTMANFSSKVLRGTMFNAVERFNRRWATAVGSHWFDELAGLAPNSVAAQKMLLRHGVRDVTAANAREQFTQNFVRRTQFRLTPEELPAVLSQPGTRGEIVKTMFQFKPFTYKATELMLQEMKANPAGFLARSIGFGVPIGGAANELRHATGGSRKERGVPRRLVESVTTLGVAGILNDLVTASEGDPAKVLELFTGPTLSMAAEGATAAYRTLQGRPSGAARMLVRRIPVAGPYLAGQLPHGGGRQQHSILPQ